MLFSSVQYSGRQYLLFPRWRLPSSLARLVWGKQNVGVPFKYAVYDIHIIIDVSWSWSKFHIPCTNKLSPEKDRKRRKRKINRQEAEAISVLFVQLHKHSQKTQIKKKTLMKKRNYIGLCTFNSISTVHQWQI